MISRDSAEILSCLNQKCVFFLSQSINIYLQFIFDDFQLSIKIMFIQQIKMRWQIRSFFIFSSYDDEKKETKTNINLIFNEFGKVTSYTNKCAPNSLDTWKQKQKQNISKQPIKPLTFWKHTEFTLLIFFLLRSLKSDFYIFFSLIY